MTIPMKNKRIKPDNIKIHHLNYDDYFPGAISFNTFVRTKIENMPDERSSTRSSLGIDNSFATTRYFTLQDIEEIANGKIRHLKRLERGEKYVRKWEILIQRIKEIKEAWEAEA